VRAGPDMPRAIELGVHHDDDELKTILVMSTGTHGTGDLLIRRKIPLLLVFAQFVDRYR
jgi:hypothetical protein